MKSTRTFKQFFYEDSVVGVALGGSEGGFSPGNISSSDFYAKGDARLPTGGAVISRKGRVKTKKKKRRSRKNKK